MELETILISICILLLIGVGYFIYFQFQLLQKDVDSISKNLDEVNQALESFSKKIINSLEKLLEKKLDFYFSTDYKVERGDHWLNEAKSEKDELKQLTLLEQGAKRYPFHKEIHSQLFEVFFKTLDNETTLLRRKAILDKMIPISQDYRENASINHFDHANGLFRKTEEAARSLIDDLNQHKNDLVEERLKELSKILNQIESHIKKSKYDMDAIENLIQSFKELEEGVDKKLVSQSEDLSKVYKDNSERFAALLRKAATDQEIKKRKEYNLKKLKEIEKVSIKLKEHAENNVKFTNKLIQDFTKSIFIDKPELASDKLLQYAQSIFNELFTSATRNQRKLMTEIMINLEYE